MIEVESAEAELKSREVRVDEEAASVKADEAQALKNECESELAEAIPALEAARTALNTLKVLYSRFHYFYWHSPTKNPYTCFGCEPSSGYFQIVVFIKKCKQM